MDKREPLRALTMGAALILASGAPTGLDWPIYRTPREQQPEAEREHLLAKAEAKRERRRARNARCAT